jgi:hypothetical protein
MRRLTLVSLAVVLTLTLVAVAGGQQPPRDPNRPAPPAMGKGVIVGQVVAADTGQPLPGVRVFLDGGGTAPGRSATTDARGQFEFADLPAARYTLTANRPGFVESIYGQQQPGSGRPGTPIQLADGQALKNIALRLPKGGVITGLVVDEFGYPSTGTPVRIYRTVFRNGERALMQVSSSQTDDRGIYRAYGLVPAEYVVVATPRLALELAAREKLEAEMAAQAVQYETIVRANALAEMAKVIEARAGAVAPNWAAAPGPAPPTEGYAAVYFPGTTVAAMATRVSLGVSEEKSGVDIALQVVPLSTINGYVSGASPLPAGLSVYLTESGPLSVMGGRSTRVDQEGRFAFTGIPPGQYHVTVRSPLRPAVAAVPAAPGQPGARAVEAAPAQWLWAQAEVTVAGQPRSDVSLSLAPGMTVSGSIAFRGSSLPAPELTRVRLNFLPISPSAGAAEMELASGSARVDEQGRFTAVGLMPGRYRITASGAGSWLLSSVTAQGREALDFPLDIRPGEDVGGVVVTFGDRTTTLSGALQDASGQPAAGYTVVVFADDNRYWTPLSRRVQAVRPATDGHFSFRNLPPGEYRLAAVIDPEPGQWFDPEFLRQLVVASTNLRLAEAETKTQDLRVAR